MNCYQCGADVGESLGLCAPCQKARMGEPLPEIPLEPNENMEAVRNFFYSWPGKVFLFLILSAVVFLLVGIFQPKLKLPAASLLSVAIIFSLVSMYGWAKMWSELLVNEPALAVLAFLFPPLVYRCVITYPERLMKPFALHLSTAFISRIIAVTALNMT